MHCLSRKILHSHCFQFPLGVIVKRNSKQCLLKILWSKQETRNVQVANEPVLKSISAEMCAGALESQVVRFYGQK